MQVLFCAQILTIITIILQQLRTRMESNDDNPLPSLFPERDDKILFPIPWTYRDFDATKHRTPKRDSDQWKAVMKFRNSINWNKRADLQKFADYFGVDQSGLSQKIRESLNQWTEGAGSSQGEPPHPPHCSSPSHPRATTDAGRRNLRAGPAVTAAAAPATAGGTTYLGSSLQGEALPAGAGGSAGARLASHWL